MFQEIWSFAPMGTGLCFGLAGLIVGVVGLVTGYLQTVRSRDGARWRKQQLLASINRASQLSIPQHIVDAIDQGDVPAAREMLRAWVYSINRSASETYADAVFSYLALEETFTYDDLERARRAGIINNRSEEQVWRALIALRDENRSVPAPDPQPAPGASVTIAPDAAADPQPVQIRTRPHKKPGGNGAQHPARSPLIEETQV
jgi:hypothetical protein